ncbi:NosD domain-containing protein [Halobacteriales archaeon Cl-PHB]
MVDVRYVGVGVLAVLLLASTAFVAAPTSGENLSPVPFDRTLSTGMTGVDVQQARTAGYVIPQAEVFYSQYEYVVGYYGVVALADGLQAAEEAGQFGQPLAIFVTDFAGAEPYLTDGGFVKPEFSTSMGWTTAADAHFVIDSGAKTPGGPAILPFSARADARDFADEYGGEVIGWAQVRSQMTGQGSDAGDRLAAIRNQTQTWADQTVTDARELRDRPVSTVVGEDAPTLEAAIEQAPAGTTVRLPPGTYEGNWTVSKSLTLQGAGAETVLDGGGNGSVLTVRSPEVAVTSLQVEGIGSTQYGSAANATGDQWDERIRLVYGRGDAGIRLADSPGSLVADVTIDTPANGVVALNSSDTVVRNISVEGSAAQADGFMGVLAMYSKIVVEDSTFTGGKDGVYTHYSDGIVVRDNVMHDQRFGVHEMYTSNSFIANNTMHDTDVGVIVMTRPVGNVLVENEVRRSDQGLAVVGGASFVAENTVVNNDIGIAIGSDRTYYARNTIVRNDVGIRSSTLLPTNDVVGNDVVANEQYVATGAGTRNVWAADGRGNYWGPVPGVDVSGDGVVDRAFRPGSRLDGNAASSLGAATLSQSPAVSAIREFQSQVPGLRGSSIVDPAPLAEPVRPEILERLNVTTEVAG